MFEGARSTLIYKYFPEESAVGVAKTGVHVQQKSHTCLLATSAVARCELGNVTSCARANFHLV